MGVLFVLLMGLGWMGQEATPAAAPVAQPPAAAASAEKADVCAVMRAPKAFFGHYLEISGIVMGKETEKLILISRDCQFGTPLGFTSDVQGHEDVRALFAAIRRGNPGTTDKDISGDFEGSLIFSEQGEVVRMQVDRVDSLKFPKR